MKFKKNWSIKDMPGQHGKIVLITGANDGLGFEMTRVFAGKSAHVIMACRNLEKAERAKKSVLQRHPDVKLDIVKLDLGDLNSVKSCSETILTGYDKLDMVMCNGGIMAVPFGRTKDGFETHMGVNYYGHFALVGHVLSLIKRTPGARVVTTSSLAEKFGKLNFNRPYSDENYRRYFAYGDSKLAILMLGLMLDEKFKANGIDALGLSAHPGFTRSNLRTTRLKTENNLWQRFQLHLYEMMSMSLKRGTYPILLAATDPNLMGGEYIGVSGIGEVQGYPKITKAQKRAYDPQLRTELWTRSEQLTGVKYAF